MKRLTLQYISDIHLERRTKFPRIPIVSQHIALLGNIFLSSHLLLTSLTKNNSGDIGNPFTYEYQEFMRYISYNTDRVFLVPGNHEFWHHKQTEDKVC